MLCRPLFCGPAGRDTKFNYFNFYYLEGGHNYVRGIGNLSLRGIFSNEIVINYDLKRASLPTERNPSQTRSSGIASETNFAH